MYYLINVEIDSHLGVYIEALLWFVYDLSPPKLMLIFNFHYEIIRDVMW
jgi:hypothetical protein